MAKLLFKRRSRIPGSRFTPTDIEILKILERRSQGGKQSRVVRDIHNLYEKEPWLVQHVRHVRFNENEWFYFVIRTKLAGVKKADSTRTSRRVGGSGRWKSTGTLTEIEDDNGVTVGSFQNISYLVKKGEKEEFTGWVMHEFLLNTKGFQQVSLCRLRFNLGTDNCNAPYAPLLQPIMIGRPPEEDDAPSQQWNIGSCSAQNMGQDSNYLIHGDFGSYCQQQNQILGNMAAYQNPYLGHQTDPSQVPMINGLHATQPMNGGGMMHNQNFGFSGQFAGEYSGQVAHLSPLERFFGQGTVPSHLTQATGQQQFNVESGSYSALQPYDQGMTMEHQDSGSSSTTCLAQNNQYLGLNNDLSGVYTQTQQGMLHENGSFDHNVAGDVAIQQQDLGNDSNFSLTQQCVDYTGQALDEEQQCVGYTDPSLAQPYDQGIMEHLGSSTPCLAQNNGRSVVDDPMEAEQGIEHENSCSDHNDDQQLHLGRDSNLLSTQDKYTSSSSPSSVQAHDPENNNNVESSEKKEDEVDDPVNLGEEKWNNIMRLGEDVWNNLMSLNDVQNYNNIESIDLDDLKNLGAEDWDYIKSFGENDWNNLIISSN